MNKLIQSSQNPEQLSASIQGALMIVISLLIPEQATEAEVLVVSLGDYIVNFVDQATLLVGSVVGLYGVIRKFFNLLKKN